MVIDDVQPVMVTDASVNSHPIIVDVNHPDQINEVFDAISYSKVIYNKIVYQLPLILTALLHIA